MIFKVTDKDVREDNPEIDSVEEFREISDRNLRYIFLVYDYESPFRKLPTDVRKEKVAENVGFKKEKDGKRFDKNARNIIGGKISGINKAIRVFIDLQYDEDKEEYRALSDAINGIRSDLKKSSKDLNETKKKLDIALKLPDLVEARKRLSQILELKNTDDKDDNYRDENLSTLDLINEGIIENENA